MLFTISNASKGEFVYNIFTSQDWITVTPSSGDIKEETDSITVIIDKTNLSENTYEETIKINTYFKTVLLQEILLNIYVNDLSDVDSNRYSVVKIGNQLWMAENLNTGFKISEHISQTNNGVIEKYCYAGSDYYCDIYGGLYQWEEMMQFNSSDTGTIGTTQGICPDGWHIPTDIEWRTLINFVGGSAGKLMETGILHWQGPNSFATNSSGFTVLPAGMIAGTPGEESLMLGLWANWWSSAFEAVSVCARTTRLENNNENIGGWCYNVFCGVSVRCVKDP